MGPDARGLGARRPRGAGRAWLAGLAGIVLAGLVAGGCSRDAAGPEYARTLELLEREPTLLVAGSGRLVPDPERAWRDHQGHGWNRESELHPSEGPAAHSTSVEAGLTLVVAERRARPLVLRAWLSRSADDPERVAELEVLLNGVSMGLVSLGTRPRNLGLETPAEAWRRGANELSLRLPAEHMRRDDDGRLRGLALARIDYGSDAQAERSGAGFRLDSGAALRYRLEPRGQAELRVRGATTDAGELEVRLTRLSPATAGELPGAAQPPVFRQDVDGDFDLHVELPSAEGGVLEVEVGFRAAGSGAGELLLSSLALSETEPPPPSILLISIDTLAASHMSLFGYGRPTTPTLERFAEDAVVFEHCRANAPWTMPSYAALVSGAYPSSARMSPNLVSAQFAATLPAKRWTLAEALGAAGYRTAAFVDSPNVRARLGFDQGFELFDESALAIGHGEPGGGFRTVMPAALDWLDGLDPQQPFFAFLHANDVHGPYLPEDPERRLWRDDELFQPGRELPTGALSGVFAQVPAHILGSELGDFARAAERLPAAPFVAAYDESIRSMDRMLGEFFDALEARGLLDDTIVVFTADHGEAFDEHDYFGHGLLFDEVLRVPLVVRVPGGPGRRVDTAVQLVDVYPTLLGLTGLAVERPDFHGRDLGPLLAGEELEPLASFAEGGIMRQSAVVLEGWKLIETWPGEDSVPWTMLSNPALPEAWRSAHLPAYSERALDQAHLVELGLQLDQPDEFWRQLGVQLEGPLYELFDLSTDPRELHDLAAERPALVERLKPHLAAAQARLAEARAELIGARIELDPADLAELEKLGY